MACAGLSVVLPYRHCWLMRLAEPVTSCAWCRATGTKLQNIVSDGGKGFLVRRIRPMNPYDERSIFCALLLNCLSPDGFIRWFSLFG